VFGSVVAGAFQIAFRAEIHANDFFYFLKIIFNISTSKRSKKYKPHSILVKKKIQNLAKRSYKRNAKQSHME
jgi:AAA15 family ATPase/GTPase